jgi:hypothetical protein
MEQSGVKLTKAQRDALKLIAAGHVRQVRRGFAAWRIWGASPTVVGRLIQTLKLAEWGPLNGDERPCLATHAGLAALSPENDDGR